MTAEEATNDVNDRVVAEAVSDDVRTEVSIDEGTYTAEAIPPQLRTNDFRFIKLFNPTSKGRFIRKGKEPMESAWQKENNYAYTDKRIVDHINAGMNYGVLPRGMMCILDVDDIQAFKDLEASGVINFTKLFGDTFFVQTGHASGNHGHYYFQTAMPSNNTPHKIVLTHPETNAHLGEIYQGGANAFVCGPNSLHESGNRYVVANDVPIKAISYDDFRAFVGNFTSIDDESEQYQKTIPLSFSEHCTQNLLTTKLGLKIQDIAMPKDAMYLGDGEYQGAHPIHGSTTGHNFNININKNVWKCFRCDSGGDPAVFLAVKYGLITCEEAKPGVLSNTELFKDLLHKMRDDPLYGARLAELEEKDESFLSMEKVRNGKPDWMKCAVMVNDAINNCTYEGCKNGERPIIESVNLDDMDVEDISFPLEPASADDEYDDGSNIAYKSKFANDNEDIEDCVDADNDVGKKEKQPRQKLEAMPESEFFGVKATGKDIDKVKAFKHNEHGSDVRYNVDVEFKDDDTPEIIEMKKRDIFNPPSINELELVVNLEPDNFVSKYVSTISPMTDAYKEYHYSSAYMLLSLIANRKAVVKLRQGWVYSNVWCFILGTSSISRKSTSIKFASKIATEINREGAIPSDFTPEAMIEFLSESPVRWYFKDEAGTILAGLQQKAYMSSIRDILCSLYDNQDYHRKLRSKKEGQTEFNVIDPYLSIYFSTTFDTFSMYTTRIDMTSGLLYRFLYFIPRHGNREYLPLSPELSSDNEKFDAILRDATKRYKVMASANAPFEFCMDSEGWKFFQEWQTLREKQCEARTNKAQSSAIARLIPMSLKLAMLFTIGSSNFIKKFEKYEDLNDYITKHKLVKDISIPTKYIVEACRQIDEYFYPALVYMADDVGLDEENNDVVKILKQVERAGGRISITKLMQAVHMKKRELDDAMSSLIQSKELILEQEKDGRTKRMTTWVVLGKNLSDETDFYNNPPDDDSPETAQNCKTKKDEQETLTEIIEG